MDWGKIIFDSFISGLIAGIFAIISTIVVEKLGTRIGGLIGTIPFTFLPASYNFLQQPSIDSAKSSLAFIGFGCHAGIGFLYSWKLLIPLLSNKLTKFQKLFILLIVSLIIWFSLATIIVLLFNITKKSVPFLILMWVGLLLHAITGLSLSYMALPSQMGKKKVSIIAYCSRGILAFLSIFVSSILVKSGQGIVGSVASLFPAIFLTTMISLLLSQGEDIILSVVGPMCVGGLSWSGYSCALFMISFYANLNIFLSITIALILSLIFIVIPLRYYLYWRESRYIQTPNKVDDQATIVIPIAEIKTPKSTMIISPSIPIDNQIEGIDHNCIDMIVIDNSQISVNSIQSLGDGINDNPLSPKII